MYRHHFGLREKPFRVVPSPKFLFASETHDESRARILYGIRDSRGFVVVYGGIGLGKTTVLLSVLEELEERVRTALVFNPVANFQQLLKMVGNEYGLPTEGRDEVDLLHALNNYLVERLAAGETCVLLIDEAQNLSVELLEQLRTLSNLQSEDRSLLQIVLVGQPELYDRLQDPRLVQLRQRVGVWHEILPLDAQESEEYIHHRLALAGAARERKIIPAESCRAAHGLSGGIPRLINQLCDTAMVIAYGRDSESVTPAHLEEAARELRIADPAAARPAAAPARKPRRALREPSPRRRIPAWGWGAGLVAVVVTLALLARAAGWFPSPPVGASEEPLRQDAVVGQVVGGPDGPDAVPQPANEPSAPRLEPVALPASETFTVHLASFRERDRANGYARDLRADNPAATWVVMVEETQDEPAWYRVLAGQFVERAEARLAMRQMRELEGVRYAQLVRLGDGTRALWVVGEAVGRTDG